jgi:hypothetical protein
MGSMPVCSHAFVHRPSSMLRQRPIFVALYPHGFFFFENESLLNFFGRKPKAGCHLSYGQSRVYK